MGGKRTGGSRAEQPISGLANFPDSGHALDVHSKVLTAIAAILTLVGASSCHRPKPKLSDEVMRAISLDSPGMTPGCLNAIRFGGIDAMSDRTDQCFAMTKPQRWRGLWLDAFEGQRFCPAPAQSCEDDGKDRHIWITFPNDARPSGEAITAKTYAIEFVGRRTLLPGSHGHMGMSAHEIIVDKLISVTPVD